MVELTKLLLTIIQDRKDTLSGEDIKNIAQAIQLSESMVKPTKDKDAKTPEQVIKEWMGD